MNRADACCGLHSVDSRCSDVHWMPFISDNTKVVEDAMDFEVVIDAEAETRHPTVQTRVAVVRHGHIILIVTFSCVKYLSNVSVKKTQSQETKMGERMFRS